MVSISCTHIYDTILANRNQTFLAKPVDYYKQNEGNILMVCLWVAQISSEV